MLRVKESSNERLIGKVVIDTHVIGSKVFYLVELEDSSIELVDSATDIVIEEVNEFVEALQEVKEALSDKQVIVDEDIKRELIEANRELREINKQLVEANNTLMEIVTRQSEQTLVAVSKMEELNFIERVKRFIRKIFKR